MELLYWSKQLFGNKLLLKRGQEQIGIIVWDNFFSSQAHATINGHRFLLKRDLLHSKLEILDVSNQLLLGSVIISLLNPRSDVIINGKRFELEIKNFWQSHWAWSYNGVEFIKYQSNEMLSRDKGQIEIVGSHDEDIEVLLLMGLFVRTQMLLFMVILAILLILIVIR